MSPESWFTDEYCASVSTKPHSGNIRGGAVGTRIADEAHEVRDDEPVAEAGEALVVLEVDPEQREADDGELREPVRVGGQRDHQRRAVDEALDRRLEERAELLLRAKDPLTVREGDGDVAVRCPARHLVRHVEAHPDRELEG